jgi:ATP-dependent DNA ligase
MPMLAAPARELPRGEEWTYEPKWDGFRCVAYVDAGEVDLRSRHGKPLARHFPEVVEALAALPRDCVLDGELLAYVDGVPDFAALMARLHPAATRVERARSEAPASYVAFDLMAEAGEDLTERPFTERRRRLVALLDGSGVRATPSTADPAEAEQWLARPPGGAIDGVVAKAADLTYQPGKRVMVKVKRERTVECVVAGMRVNDGPVLSSLLLGLWEGSDLVHVGVVQAFAASERARLVEQLAAYVSPPAGHPWEHLAGAAPDWVPLRPVLVAEVAYSQVDGLRFRHPARLVRWRPDRDAASCRTEQIG